MNVLAAHLPNRQGPRATIHQVAAEAGVSIATVSGVLSQRPDCRVSPQTRTRVRAAAQRLHYRPSRMAHALHGKATMTLGLVSAFDITRWVRSVSSFEKAARERGYLVLTASTHNQPELEDRLINEMLDRHVDALAVYPSEQGPHAALSALAGSGYPVLTFDAGSRLDFPIDDVSIDQHQGGLLQARHLVEIGCRRVCAVAPAEKCYVNDRKLAGLEAGLKQAGLAPAGRMELVRPWEVLDENQPNICDEIRDFLAAHAGQFDALATVGDMLALEALRAARELGLRVPEDLAVISFNDLPVSGLMVPSLSTMADPAEELGRVALETLLDRLENPQQPQPQPQKIQLQPVLRARQSTARQGS